MDESRGGWGTAFVVGVMSVLAVQFLWSIRPSDGFWNFDSFEPWEPAQSRYLRALPDDIRSGFADDGHAVAYALAADCFARLEPTSAVEIAVREACAASNTDLADVMTLTDLCDYLGQDGGRDVPRVNGGRICGE